MSNHAVKKHRRETPKHSFLVAIAVTLVVIAIVTLPLYERFFDSRNKQNWPFVAAHILETRIAVAGMQDHAYRPGEIDYLVEAHVIYELDGVHHDGWLPASNIVADRVYLQYWLSQRKSKLCIVHWNPRNPADIEAVLS